MLESPDVGSTTRADGPSNNAIGSDVTRSMGMAANNAVPPVEELFPFPLDDFQLEAIDSLNQGHSVVVSAPTGSGKTLVGEYAIHRALAHGQKVFYTTPSRRSPTRNCAISATSSATTRWACSPVI